MTGNTDATSVVPETPLIGFWFSPGVRGVTWSWRRSTLHFLFQNFLLLILLAKIHIH